MKLIDRITLATYATAAIVILLDLLVWRTQ